jgi:hypothetical protein
MTEQLDTPAFVAAEYPDHRNHKGIPQLHWWDIDVEETADGIETERIYARLLGFDSSRDERHTAHTEKYAPQKWKCSACRWVEVSIYDIRRDPAAYKRYKGAFYLVHTVGRSNHPDETDRVRIKGAHNAFAVLEALHFRQQGTARLTVPAANAMAEACGYDATLAQVYKS